MPNNTNTEAKASTAAKTAAATAANTFKSVVTDLEKSSLKRHATYVAAVACVGYVVASISNDKTTLKFACGFLAVTAARLASQVLNKK